MGSGTLGRIPKGGADMTRQIGSTQLIVANGSIIEAKHIVYEGITYDVLFFQGPCFALYSIDNDRVIWSEPVPVTPGLARCLCNEINTQINMLAQGETSIPPTVCGQHQYLLACNAITHDFEDRKRFSEFCSMVPPEGGTWFIENENGILGSHGTAIYGKVILSRI